MNGRCLARDDNDPGKEHMIQSSAHQPLGHRFSQTNDGYDHSFLVCVVYWIVLGIHAMMMMMLLMMMKTTTIMMMMMMINIWSKFHVNMFKCT